MEFLVSSCSRQSDLARWSFEVFGVNFLRKLRCFTLFLSYLRTQPVLKGLGARSGDGAGWIYSSIERFSSSVIFLTRLLQWVEHVFVRSFLSKISLWMEVSLSSSSWMVSSFSTGMALIDFCLILGRKKILFLGEGACLRLVYIQLLMSQSTSIFLRVVTLSKRRFSMEFQRLIALLSIQLLQCANH